MLVLIRETPVGDLQPSTALRATRCRPSSLERCLNMGDFQCMLRWSRGIHQCSSANRFVPSLTEIILSQISIFTIMLQQTVRRPEYSRIRRTQLPTLFAQLSEIKCMAFPLFSWQLAATEDNCCRQPSTHLKSLAMALVGCPVCQGSPFLLQPRRNSISSIDTHSRKT